VSTVVSVLTLLAVLGLVAWGRFPDVVVAGAAAVWVVALGLVSLDDALDTVDQLLPTLVFLGSILVIAEVARAAGLFEVLGDRITRRAGSSGRRIVWLVSLAAIAVTVVMSLDATAVLFTPVVVNVVNGMRNRRAADREPSLLATTQLANASSGLLPVSNLTNLLVFSATGLTFGGFAARMALPTAVASAVVIVVALAHVPSGVPEPLPLPRSETGAEGPDPGDAGDVGDAPVLDSFGRLVVAMLGLLVVAFFVVSQLGGAPAWVAAVFAVLLGGCALARRRDRVPELLGAASPRFLVFVAALAVVVDAAVGHGLGDLARDALPSGVSLIALLGIAAVAMVLANLVNNVPATLVLLGAIGPGSAPRLLAMLIGVNIGPNLTYTGSLATLLWRTAVRRAGVEPRHRAFYRYALLATPLAVVLATVALWATTVVLR
jgi:arsenical pump membrane protein